MRNNNSQPSTPSGQFGTRFRLPSFTSPNLSPLKMLPSPFIGQNSFINLSNQGELQNFSLEEHFGNENSQKYQEFEEIRQEENPPLFDFQIKQQEEQSDYLDEKQEQAQHSNILEFILKYCKRDNQKLERARETLQDSGPQIIKRLFDNLFGKFSKLKKTKEEMVKYCVRKSFKYITNKMRAQNREAYIEMQNSQVTALYFQRHCEGDQSISMPFQKTSEQKTMNSAFLKKIFKCRQYNLDYNEFLRQFPNQLLTDNLKKVKSMNETIKKVVKNKCLKSIDQYKRLPWTRQILLRLNEFARSLVQHSPFKKQQLYQRRIVQKNSNKEPKDHRDSFDDQSLFFNENTQLKAPLPKKNSVIILTPPLRPLTDPFPVPEDQL